MPLARAFCPERILLIVSILILPDPISVSSVTILRISFQRNRVPKMSRNNTSFSSLSDIFRIVVFVFRSESGFANWLKSLDPISIGIVFLITSRFSLDQDLSR